MLNVERYQYTKGPRHTVGLKLLLHGQNDVQSVLDFGDNIPVGMSTFVAVGLSKVSSSFLVGSDIFPDLG